MGEFGRLFVVVVVVDIVLVRFDPFEQVADGFELLIKLINAPARLFHVLATYGVQLNFRVFTFIIELP